MTSLPFRNARRFQLEFVKDIFDILFLEEIWLIEMIYRWKRYGLLEKNFEICWFLEGWTKSQRRL
jgi:hypothetical protein